MVGDFDFLSCDFTSFVMEHVVPQGADIFVRPLAASLMEDVVFGRGVDPRFEIATA